MKPRANPRYLTPGEVAARFRVRPSTVLWLIRTEQLSAHRIAEEFLIEESDLAAFIEAHIVPPQREGGGGRTG